MRCLMQNDLPRYGFLFDVFCSTPPGWLDSALDFRVYRYWPPTAAKSLAV